MCSTVAAEDPSSPESFLFGLRARGVVLGLEPTRAALDAIGAPDRAMRIVQVAGSIGKGSTATMIAAILRAAGLRTGLFTSPHLVRFGERFVVDGREASREEIEGALRFVRARVPWAEAGDSHLAGAHRPLTFFEWATVLGCHLFRDAGVQVAVMEVGLGGRWDATTACHADVTVITRLDLEHTDLLGDTLSKIASEKAGVMRPGAPCITTDQPPEALEALQREARLVGSPLAVLRESFGVSCWESGERFDYKSGSLSLKGLRAGLVGRHQMENAGLAVAALEALAAKIPALADRLPGAVSAGLAAAELPGRMEEMRPGVWLDGAHTRGSILALVDQVKTKASVGRAHVVFAALRDKPVATLLELLREVALSITLTRAGGDRALDPTDLAGIVEGWGIPWEVEPDPMVAIDKAASRDEGVPVVVCGSLYLVGAVKALSRGVIQEPGDPLARR